MSERMKAENNSIYIVDDAYNIVYANEAIFKTMPEVQLGDYCYRALCHENAPCKNCPLEREEKGGNVFWNRRLGTWVNATAGKLTWPGAGDCHFVSVNALEGDVALLPPEELERVAENQKAKAAPQSYSEINSLTGLYYNRAFFQKADEKLQRIGKDTHELVAIDIEHFRLFNKLYGRDEGDRLLAYIAGCVKKIQEEQDGVAGYLGGDNFAVLMPKDERLLARLNDEIVQGVKRMNTVGFLPGFGVYEIVDPSMPAVVMYDRATIALSHIIGNYMKRVNVYDDSMVAAMEEELSLLAEIQVALENDEFTFFVQPQCDIATGKIVGAESLVRWKHRTKGMIPPGIFIPVLEKNGFIADLDRLVWRKVCEWLRQWMDRGFQPVPISINVSRIDIFSMDVPAYLNELLETYRLKPSNLKVEITESAYAENNDKIVDTVRRLQEAGFLVMMDDFGSGYSSLNMLKSVSVDVIKIDMKFLDMNEQEDEKGIGILESVVNMSRQMGLPIIVEGVETKKQESFLQDMGCRYMQGYYYYKPLPIADFEALLSDESRLDPSGILQRQAEVFHVREFLDENLFNDAMVNNILGAAAFYDLYENRIEILRVNDQYYQLAGMEPETEEDGRQRLWDHVQDEDRQALLFLFEHAYTNPRDGAQGYVHFLRRDGGVLWVYLRVFFLREREGHKTFYGSLMDMTQLREASAKTRAAELPVREIGENGRQQMEAYYGDMPCGYGVLKIALDEYGNACNYEIVYTNHEMECVAGGSERRMRHFVLRAFADNQEELLYKAYQAAYLGEVVNHYMYLPSQSRYLQLTLYQYDHGYAGCILRDVTHLHIYEDTLRGVLQSCREVYYIQLEENYYRMVYPDENQVLERGNYEAAIERHITSGLIAAEDREAIRRQLSIATLQNELADKDRVEYKYLRRFGDTVEWCQTSITVSHRVKGRPQTVTMAIRSIDALVKEEESRRKEQMAQTLAGMSEGFFIYRATEDEQVLYANPPLLRMYGCGSIHEFRELVGNSFRGMVHPDDLERIEREIDEQIARSDRKMDYIRYRIIRKDGEERWVDDCGHLEESEPDGKLFYVFLSDITDTITEQQKTRLLLANQTVKAAEH